MVEMMWRMVLVLLLVGLLGGCGPGGGRQTIDESFVRVSPRDSRYFELSNGEPFIPIGLNIAFPRFLIDEDAVYRKMEERMRNLSENGGNLIRVWLGHPFYNVEHQHSGRYDSMKIRRIDHILALARKYHLRIEFTFDYFRTLEEEAPRFAGAPSLGNPLQNESAGGPAKDMTEFFTLAKSKARYKRKLAWFAKRYRDEPAVFAWELWDEINEVSGGGWQAWTEEMLQELHTLFPNHLAVQSVGNLDVYRKRLLFATIWKLPENDFVEVHRFLDRGADLEADRGPIDVMAADAIRTAAAIAPGKPVLLGETGAVEPGQSGPSRLYEKDQLGSILHDVLFAPFFAGSAGTGQIWHWYFYVEKQNLWGQFGRFAEMVKGIDPPAEGFVSGMLEQDRLRTYTLRGKHTFLAWCRDKEADWRRDLEQSAVEPVRGAVLDFTQLESGAPPGRVRLFNPWTDEWIDARLEEGKLELPTFLRSMVVRIDR